MLHRLRVQRLKSLRDVTVELGQLNIVFGPNAAGKSNLLESLVLLSRLVQERTLADAFGSGIRGYPVEAFSFGEDGIEGLMAQQEASLRLEAQLSGARKGSMEYHVEVGMRPQTGDLFLLDERLRRLNKDGSAKGNAAIEQVDRGEGGPRLAIRRKGGPNHPYEERLGIHHTLVSNLQSSGEERYPDFDNLREEVGAWRVVYLDPREVMRRAQPPREVNDIGERGEHLVPFLHRLGAGEEHKKVLAAIIRGVRAVIPSIESLETALVRVRGEIDLRVRQDGIWMSSRVISEGTLRVIALCAMAANPFTSGLIAFEEPENGVHPRRIESITKILASAAQRRQVVVTTHSPLVVGEVIRMLRSKELDEASVRLLHCSGGPDGTIVETFVPHGPLFDDRAIAQSLLSTDDDSLKIQAALTRGWLDG